MPKLRMSEQEKQDKALCKAISRGMIARWLRISGRWLR